jgi:hypothetical protein
VYVKDITDMNELNELLAEVQDQLLADPLNEQAQWDMEDIMDRIDEISYPAPKLERLVSRPSPFAQ